MKFIELFAGIGGFRLGLEKAHDDFECVWANERDKYACQIYSKNFGGDELYEGDIAGVESESIPDHELLVGGFPCQAFSIAGKRRGFEDTRGTLFFEIARIIRDKRPRLFLLENVRGLLNHDEGRTFETILAAISDLGYNAEWQVLNSKNFGVPQNRERVFIVGYIRDGSGPEVFPITGNSESDYVVPTLTGRYKDGQANGAYLREITPQGTSQGYRVYDTDGISVTLASQAGGVGAKTGLYKTKSGIRRLTPVECERLQGFPDGWTEGVSDSQRYKCLGNAVTVNVIKAIGERLIQKGAENEKTRNTASVYKAT